MQFPCRDRTAAYSCPPHTQRHHERMNDKYRKEGGTKKISSGLLLVWIGIMESRFPTIMSTPYSKSLHVSSLSSVGERLATISGISAAFRNALPRKGTGTCLLVQNRKSVLCCVSLLWEKPRIPPRPRRHLRC